MRLFLRHNSRHHLYWRVSGPDGMGRPQLNPISSSYGRGIRNISWHEPLWLFRLRQRVFAQAGRQRCGRRAESWHGAGNTDLLPDTWDIGPDGCRTCSYCGSAHPDDLIRICRLAIEDERYAVEGTDKGYKVYLRQPGVRNASEGAIKFYMQHAPKEPTREHQELFRAALRLSAERAAARWRRHG